MSTGEQFDLARIAFRDTWKRAYESACEAEKVKAGRRVETQNEVGNAQGHHERAGGFDLASLLDKTAERSDWDEVFDKAWEAEKDNPLYKVTRIGETQ